MNRKKIRNENLYKALIFLIKFNLFAIPLYIIMLSGFQWASLKDLTADLSFAMVQASGIGAERNGDIISVPVQDGTWAARIDWDCTGWKSMLAFFALVFATAYPLRKKIIGLASILLIYPINLFRIWFMFFYVHRFGLNNFSVVHETLWSWGMIAVILILWIVWMRLFRA